MFGAAVVPVWVPRGLRFAVEGVIAQAEACGSADERYSLD